MAETPPIRRIPEGASGLPADAPPPRWSVPDLDPRDLRHVSVMTGGGHQVLPVAGAE